MAEEWIRSGKLLRVEAEERILGLISWLPRLLYAGVVLYIGWLVITTFMGYLGTIQQLIEAPF